MVEFSLVFPFLTWIFMGVYEVSRAVDHYFLLAHAARVGVREASSSPAIRSALLEQGGLHCLPNNDVPQEIVGLFSTIQEQVDTWRTLSSICLTVTEDPITQTVTMNISSPLSGFFRIGNLEMSAQGVAPI